MSNPKKPFYDDVNGSTAKFLPLVNKYVVELEAENDKLRTLLKNQLSYELNQSIRDKINEALNPEKDG